LTTDEGTKPLVSLGRIAKAHGLRGDVIVNLWTDQLQRVEAPAIWTVNGELMLLERSQPYQSNWLVHLKGVNSREAAEDLRGALIEAEALELEGVLWIHEMIGLPVFDLQDRLLGSVDSVIANPASDLLDLGADRLIPLSYVVDLRQGEAIVVDLPEGLIPEEEFEAGSSDEG